MTKFVQLVFVALLLSVSACQSVDEANAAPAANAKLHDSIWKLSSVNGKSVQASIGQRAASLVLTAADSRARIVTPCNGGSASFNVEGNKLTFSLAMKTKMMCPAALMEQENEFFAVVANTTRYEIKGDTLELYNTDNKLLASLGSK